jgi:hypothetical protein
MDTKLDKFLKYLWLINGILLPTLLIYYIFRDNFYTGPTYAEPDDIIVGEAIEDAKRKGLALQGINYNPPFTIYNSKNHLVEVSVHTYEEAKLLAQARASAGDIAPPPYLNLINLIFLDENYQVIRRLLNKKGAISRYEIPYDKYASSYIDPSTTAVDTTVNNIVYEIGFDDTNKDGALNTEDDHDLYISALDGSNLIKVIGGVELRDYSFRKNHSEILITYKDRSNEREEYKKDRYAIYDIPTGKLRLLEEIDKELAEIEKILIN